MEGVFAASQRQEVASYAAAMEGVFAASMCIYRSATLNAPIAIFILSRTGM